MSAKLMAAGVTRPQLRSIRIVSFRRGAASLIPVVVAVAVVGPMINRSMDVAPSYWSTVVALVNGQAPWWSPRVPVNGGLIDKPPLYFWLAAAAVKAFGFHIWAARLPDTLAGVLTVWLVGRITLSRGSACSWVLALTPAWITGAVSIPITPELVWWLTLCAFCAVRWSQGQGRRWVWLGAVCWGLAFETKEWAALLPIPALALYTRVWAWRRREWADVAGPVVAAVAISVAWPAWASLAVQGTAPYGGSVVGSLVGYNLLGRMADDTTASFAAGAAFAPAVTTHPVLERGPGWWLSDHVAVLWWLWLGPAVIWVVSRVQRQGWRSMAAMDMAPWVWLGCVIGAYAVIAHPMPQYLNEGLVPLALTFAPFRQPDGGLQRLNKGVLEKLLKAGIAAAWPAVLCAGTPLWPLGMGGGFMAAMAVLLGRRAASSVVGVMAIFGISLDVLVLTAGHSQVQWETVNRVLAESHGKTVIAADMWTAAGIALETGQEPITLVDNYAGTVANITIESAVCPNGAVVVISRQLALAWPEGYARLLAHRTAVHDAGGVEIWSERC